MPIHNDVIAAIGLCGGLAVYMAAHVAMRLRIGGGWGHGRPAATVVLVLLILTFGTLTIIFSLKSWHWLHITGFCLLLVTLPPANSFCQSTENWCT